MRQLGEVRQGIELETSEIDVRTLKMWRSELLVFCRARLTNSRSDAVNLTATNMKRIGRRYTNHGN